MSTIKVVLLLGGAFLEFLGIILIAFPDLTPYGDRVSRWLRDLTHPLFNRISRLLGRSRGVTIKIHAAEEVNVAGRVPLMKSVGQGKSLEQKVEFLLTRDQEAQLDVNALRARIEDFESESSRRLAESRREIEAGFEHELRIALEEYRPLMIFRGCLRNTRIRASSGHTIVGAGRHPSSVACWLVIPICSVTLPV